MISRITQGTNCAREIDSGYAPTPRRQYDTRAPSHRNRMNTSALEELVEKPARGDVRFGQIGGGDEVLALELLDQRAIFVDAGGRPFE
jgi:hypothetical protein